MEKIIPNGTKVLIFEYNATLGVYQNENKFIKGTVCDSETVEEQTMHGSPWCVTVYKVLGEDGKCYIGNYDSRISGKHYFRTIEDHIVHLTKQIKNNCAKINQLNNKNCQLYELIRNLNDSLYSVVDSIDQAENDGNYIQYPSLEENTIALAKKNAERYKRYKRNKS